MISVKSNAPGEYYIVYAFNDEQEIILTKGIGSINNYYHLLDKILLLIPLIVP